MPVFFTSIVSCVFPTQEHMSSDGPTLAFETGVLRLPEVYIRKKDVHCEQFKRLLTVSIFHTHMLTYSFTSLL